MNTKTSKREAKLLEITMRDVLDGLEDAASYVGFQSVADTLEILSIEPPGRLTQPIHDLIQMKTQASSQLAANQTADIVEYLISRELRISA